MSAIADLSDVVNLATGGGSGSPQNLFFYKDARVAGAAAAATVAGRYSTLWLYDGQPAAGALAGGTARNPDNTTAGGLLQTDPGGGRQLWLTGVTAAPLVQGTLYLADRLADITGFSGTNTGAQNTTSLAVTRYTGTAAAGNMIAIEIDTQIGASSTTVTAAYTSQGGASHTTTATAIGNTGFREAQRMIILPLASGDTGVRAVTSVTVLATTGTAGAFGVVIFRPLAAIPLTLAGVGAARDFIAGLPGPIEIKTGACLYWYWLPNGVTAPQIFGSVHILEK